MHYKLWKKVVKSVEKVSNQIMQMYAQWNAP